MKTVTVANFKEKFTVFLSKLPIWQKPFFLQRSSLLVAVQKSAFVNDFFTESFAKNVNFVNFVWSFAESQNKSNPLN